MKLSAWSAVAGLSILGLPGCSTKAPSAPCSGVVHVTLEHGPFTFSEPGRNETRSLELLVGKRQLASTLLWRAGGKAQSFELKSWHMEAFANSPQSGVCEGVNCLTAEREIKNGRTCTSEFVLLSPTS